MLNGEPADERNRLVGSVSRPEHIKYTSVLNCARYECTKKKKLDLKTGTSGLVGITKKYV